MKKTGRKKSGWKYFLLLLVILMLIPKVRETVMSWIKPGLYQLLKSGKGSSRIHWQKIGVGIEQSTVTLKSPNIAFSTDLFLLRIDPKFFTAEVIHSPKLTSAQNIVNSTGAIAAINASFFDPQGRPLGLLIHKGKLKQRIPQTGMFDSGIFCVKNNFPYIFHRSAFESDGVTEAFQSMPRLIHDGKIISLLKNKEEKNRRSGIAIDFFGNLIVYITDTHLGGLSFEELQQFLFSSNMDIRSALNLDGGRSSQLSLNYNQVNKNIVGLSDVPVFLAFYKKGANP